jgi:hypothetical protein
MNAQENVVANINASVADLKFEDIKLIKAVGSAMLGVVSVSNKDELVLKGIACTGMPKKEDFTKLFTALVLDEAEGISVNNPQNTTTLDMKNPQRLAFAGAHAEFVVALEMRENQLTKIALADLLK